jgi:hypothetical protein
MWVAQRGAPPRRQCSTVRSALLPTSTTGKVAVKGGRRPAERTLEGCVVNDPSDKMEKAGRQAAGLHAKNLPSSVGAVPVTQHPQNTSPLIHPKSMSR